MDVSYAIPMFLSIVGIILGAIGTLAISDSIRRRARAEREIARSLAALYEARGETLKTIRDRLEADGDAAEMAEVLARIEEATKNLDDSKRSMVLTAIRQPSLQGRKAYARKLVREATT